VFNDTSLTGVAFRVLHRERSTNDCHYYRYQGLGLGLGLLELAEMPIVCVNSGETGRGLDSFLAGLWLLTSASRGRMPIGGPRNGRRIRTVGRCMSMHM